MIIPTTTRPIHLPDPIDPNWRQGPIEWTPAPAPCRHCRTVHQRDEQEKE